jgi:hypothetical protein
MKYKTSNDEENQELLIKMYNRTAPLPNSTAVELLQDLLYNKKVAFSRDGLFQYIVDNHPNVNVSRRQVWDWLKLQDVFNKIKSIIKPVIKENKPHYVVEWYGYKKNNTIEPRKSLLNDIPKMVKRYEKINGVKFKTDKNGMVYVYMKK